MSNQVNGKYFRDLDILRAIAVAMVVVHHWIPSRVNTILHYGGSMGVGLFFVLSGFLITLILLNQKEQFLSSGNAIKGKILRTFYVRRTLRIFPIYYLYIAIILILGVGQSREVWGWLITYSYNLQLWLTGTWHSGYIEHLWSLAMEEQFYIIWPIVILSVPRRYTLHTIIIFIALGMFSRGFFYMLDPKSQYTKFTFSAFDGFGIGALFAYLNLKGKKVPFLGLGFLLCFSLFVFGKWNGIHFHGKSGMFQTLPFYYLACGFAIQQAYIGFPAWLRKILDWNWVVYLGKISYGIYLYHLFVPDLCVNVLLKLGWWPSVWIFWVIYLLVLILICQLSWTLIEQPINKLKDKFSYRAS